MAAVGLAAVTGLTTAVWRWPRLGGLAMIASGLWAMWFFPGADARLLLALPSILIGATSLAGAYAGRMPR